MSSFTKSKLRELYIEENRSASYIANAFGYKGASSVYFYLNKWNIQKSQQKINETKLKTQFSNLIKNKVGSLEKFKEIVNNAKSKREVNQHLDIEDCSEMLDFFDLEVVPKREQIKNEATLRNLYIEKDLTHEQIAERYNCSSSLVGSWLNKFGIEKPHSLIWNWSNKDFKHHHSDGFSHSEKTKKKMEEYNISKEFLQYYYHELNFSSREIAKIIGCCKTTIVNKLGKFNIEKKTRQDYDQSGKNNGFYNRSHTKESKRKMRKNYIKELEEKHGEVVVPNFNPRACKLIDKYAEKYGYEFQHAKNGKEYFVEELGYWVDGYDEDKNAVIEVYESHHFKNGELRKEDKKREEEIKNCLNCEFISLKTFE